MNGLHSHYRQSRSLALAFTLLGLIVLLAAACGGSSSSPAGGTEGASDTTTPERKSWAGTQPAPAFPGGLSWFNVQEAPTVESLHGKMVLLDFWTLGCINCQHIVPDLKRLEEEFADSLVVIGVHSGKYATEHSDESVQEAVHRLSIEHPVANDPDFAFWQAYQARAWPTLVLIDPAGNVVGSHAGEGVYGVFQPILEALESEFEGAIDTTPFPLALDAVSASTLLRYPGAIATDEANDRLYIADSSNNRIVVATLDGELLRAIGTGQQGFADGAANEATFFEPHGLSVSSDGGLLYVADTRNHALRVVDTETWTVRTIAGNGERLRQLPRTGDSPTDVALASPWGLALRDGVLYIGMAGVHQLWTMDLAANSLSVFAGTSREGIDDGLRLTQATLAQPSGLALTESFLYWVDPESSAVRRVGYGDDAIVDTLSGTGLFDYGFDDGRGLEATFQHPQDIVLFDGLLYIADTYNHAIRVLDPGPAEVTTLAGGPDRGWADGGPVEALFDEPGGIAAARGLLYVADTNNHLIRTVAPATGDVSTLTLTNPGAISMGGGQVTRIEISEQSVAPGVSNIQLRVTAPAGHHLNSLAPARLALNTSNASVIEAGEREVSWSSDDPSIEVPIPVALGEGSAVLTFTGEAYYCRDGEEALCLVTMLEIVAPVFVAANATSGEIEVAFELP